MFGRSTLTRASRTPVVPRGDAPGDSCYNDGVTRRSAVAALLAVLSLIVAAHPNRLSADVVADALWRMGEGITTAIVHEGTVYVGGTFPELFSPSASAGQFYDPITGQPRAECARTDNPASGLTTTPDGQGGLFVIVHPGDAFADGNGAFVPRAGTAFVRIASTCLWDRSFAAPAINPDDPGNLTVGLPVRVGNVVYASNAIIGPDFFPMAQVASYSAVGGVWLGYQSYSGIAEVGLIGAGPLGPVVRVRTRDSVDGQFVLGAIAPDTLQLTMSITRLADESLSPKFWVPGHHALPRQAGAGQHPGGLRPGDPGTEDGLGPARRPGPGGPGGRGRPGLPHQWHGERPGGAAAVGAECGDRRRRSDLGAANPHQARPQPVRHAVHAGADAPGHGRTAALLQRRHGARGRLRPGRHRGAAGGLGDRGSVGPRSRACQARSSTPRAVSPL